MGAFLSTTLLEAQQQSSPPTPAPGITPATATAAPATTTKAKPGGSKLRLFLSHNWGEDAQGRDNHARVVRIGRALRRLGLEVSIDEDKVQGNASLNMKQDIDSADLVIVFITRAYCEKVDGEWVTDNESTEKFDNCEREFSYTMSKKGPRWILPVLMEEELASSSRWGKRLAVDLGDLLHFSLADVADKDLNAKAADLKAKVEQVHLYPAAIVRPQAVPKLLPTGPLYKNPIHLVAEKAKEFVPGTRVWLFDELMDWLATGNKVFVLTGGDEIDKSVFAAELCRRGGLLDDRGDTVASKPKRASLATRLSRLLSTAPDKDALPFVVGAVHLFKHDDESTQDLHAAFFSIANQLSLVVDGLDRKLAKCDPAETREMCPIDAFREVIAQTCRNAQPNRTRELPPVLVVLDALDEASKETEEQLIELVQVAWAQAAPAWLRLVVTTRPESYIKQGSRAHYPRVIAVEDGGNMADMRAFLETAITWIEGDDKVRAVDVLTERSGGLFRYARFLQEDLVQAKPQLGDILDEDKFPAGVCGFFRKHFMRLKNDAFEGDDGLYANVLAPLVAARGPLPQSAIAALLAERMMGGQGESRTRRRQSILNGLYRAKQVLVFHNDTVRFVHKSMADWLTDASQADDLFVNLLDGHEALAKWAQSERENPFAFAHAVFHLAQSHQQKAAMELLHDFEWLLTALADKGVSARALVLDAPDSEDEVVLALQKSLHVVCERPLELAFQLLGRLSLDHPMRGDIDQVMKARGVRWMRPIRTNLASAKGPLRTILQQTTGVTSVAISPDGHCIVSGSLDATLRVWSAETGEQLHAMPGHTGVVDSVAFSPDSQRIVSGSTDATVRVWSLETGEQLHKLPGHVSEVTSVAFSPDGQRIVCAKDRMVSVWSAETGKKIHEIRGHADWVTSVEFSPDGKRIVSGCRDETVSVWSAKTGKQLRKLRGHYGVVTSVAFSPDSQRIVSGSWDKTVRVWSAQTGEQIHEIRGHADWVNSVAFSPNGQRIVSCSRDNTVRVWSQDGEQIQEMRGHSSDVSSVVFSPDGQRIVSGSYDTTVRVWLADGGEQFHNMPNYASKIRSVAFSPDGQRIVSGYEDNTVRVWSLGGKALHVLRGHTDIVRSVAFSPDGQRIVSGSDDYAVRVWDAETGEQLYEIRGHIKEVRSVAFSPDGQCIVSGSEDKTVRVWSAETGGQLYKIRGHSKEVTSVAVSPDGQHIVSGSYDKTVRVWSLKTGEQLRKLCGHTDSVNSVAFSPDGQRIVSCSHDRTVQVWSAKTGKQLRKLQGHYDVVTSVAFSPDGQRIVSGSWDESVRICSAETGEELQTIHEVLFDRVTSVAFSPNGQSIVSGSWDKRVWVWSAETGEPLQFMPGGPDKVTSVAFSPDGQRIVSGSRDHTVRVWSAETGEQFHEMRGHGDVVNSVAFSPDGQRIVSSSDDDTVRVWSLGGKAVHVLRGHTDFVRSVAFSPDGQRIVSDSDDETVRVWSLETGEQLHKMLGHTGEVTSVAFSPDGQRIVSGSKDNTVRVWSAETGEQLHEMRGHTLGVTSVAFSPDGQRMVSGSDDSSVRVWSAETGEQLEELWGDGNRIWSVAFSPDGRCIVSSSKGYYESSEMTTRVWSVETGEQLQEYLGSFDMAAFARCSTNDWSPIIESGRQLDLEDTVGATFDAPHDSLTCHNNRVAGAVYGALNVVAIVNAGE